MLSFILSLSLLLMQPGYLTLEKTMRLDDGARVHYSLSRPMNKQDYSDKLLIVLHWDWDKEYGMPFFYGEEFLYEVMMPPLMNCNFRPIVVAPDCPDMSWSTQRSEMVLKQFIRGLDKKYDIDTTSIILAGYGEGGLGAWYFSSRNPDIIQTCIAMASVPEKEWMEQWKVEKTYVLLGERDELYPMELLNERIDSTLIASDSMEIFQVNRARHGNAALYRESLVEIYSSLENL